MRFRETLQSDLDYVADHSVSRGIQKYLPEQTEFVYTLEHDGVPLAVGGFHILNLATAWCWVDYSEESGSHTREIYRVTKEWIATFAKTHKLRRLQAYIEMDFPEAVRMVEHLGFTKESIMKNFLGDKDAYLYARVI